MRLFCRENHDAEPPVPTDYKQELLEERAHLAKLELMPLSAFAARTHIQIQAIGGQLMSFRVDNKADAIARSKARIAELQVLANLNPPFMEKE
jgi:hypothetical protein